ncbi:MAG TPA: response regulator [Aggregatilineales bacterium]|nr:response regulator [Aggregatilineales bacterium]
MISKPDAATTMTRILVVDDEIDTLDLLRTFLELSGYEVFTSLNSEDAVTLADVEHPDCALLDIMMPRLDGFRLCSMIRANPRTAKLPIMFVTAYSAMDLEEHRVEAGADMIMMKPFGMDDLVRSIDALLAIRIGQIVEAQAPAMPLRTETTASRASNEYPLQNRTRELLEDITTAHPAPVAAPFPYPKQTKALPSEGSPF